MTDLAQIPQADLVAMLRDKVFHADDHYSRGGYSLDVEPQTAYRQIQYRNAPLYRTAEEAILEHWKKHYAK